MYKNNPALLTAISSVCKDPATKIVAELPTLQHILVKESLEKLIQFISEAFSVTGTAEYLIRIDFQAQKIGEQLTAARLIDMLAIGSNLFVIDPNLYLLELDSLSPISASELSFYSKKNMCCLIHVVNGIELVIYANGLTVKEMNARQPLRGPMTRKKYARNANDYKVALIDHYQQRVRYSQFCEHWADRTKRTLHSKPKTETIFHRNLQNWLDENLEGASVIGGVKKVTSDETDIEIRVHGQRRFYIIEVKWLGSNGKTSYSESRLRDAIFQVREYLKREPDAEEVCLVTYDGRQLDDFNSLDSCKCEPEQWKEIRQCQTESLPDRSTGYVFFLENQDASKRKSTY